MARGTPLNPTEPRDPWSDEQIQSTPEGPPDAAPWTLTLVVIALLAVLLLAGYFLWLRPGQPREPDSPSAVLKIPAEAPLAVRR